jgi:hypothetical protein
LGLRIECLAELHDVQAALTQSWANRWGWVGLTSWHLQLDEADDFFRHTFLLAGNNAELLPKQLPKLPGGYTTQKWFFQTLRAELQSAE